MDRFELSEGTAALTADAETWDSLAAQRPNPFMTHAWLSQWAASSDARRAWCATLRSPDGSLLAGAVLRRVPLGLATGTSGATDWDAVAVDEAARRRLWENLARVGPQRFHLAGMYAGSPETQIACQALADAGYGVLPSVRESPCPYITLPASFDELLASRSRNTRKQLRKRQRELQAAGEVHLRTTQGGPDFERDFDSFLRVEASGWKGQQGTAIRSNAASEKLYRGFARELSKRGWLRLYLLELDHTVIAGQLAAALGGEMFLLKTGFDESRATLSPGFVLAAEVITQAIAEGLRGVDMQGRADDYKMIWADTVRPRQRLRVYRGPIGRAAQAGMERGPAPQIGRAARPGAGRSPTAAPPGVGPEQARRVPHLSV